MKIAQIKFVFEQEFSEAECGKKGHFYYSTFVISESLAWAIASISYLFNAIILSNSYLVLVPVIYQEDLDKLLFIKSQWKLTTNFGSAFFLKGIEQWQRKFDGTRNRTRDQHSLNFIF